MERGLLLRVEQQQGLGQVGLCMEYKLKNNSQKQVLTAIITRITSQQKEAAGNLHDLQSQLTRPHLRVTCACCVHLSLLGALTPPHVFQWAFKCHFKWRKTVGSGSRVESKNHFKWLARWQPG